MTMYLLDTNAYFKYLHYLAKQHIADNASIEVLKNNQCCISEITWIEIISVIGKYARGVGSVKSKCNCIISEKGDTCSNYKFGQKVKWPPKRVKAWLKMVREIRNGTSTLVAISTIALTPGTITIAQDVIIHSLKHKFGSLDSIIGATARIVGSNGDECILVTSDRGFCSGLKLAKIPYEDFLSDVKVS